MRALIVTALLLFACSAGDEPGGASGGAGGGSGSGSRGTGGSSAGATAGEAGRAGGSAGSAGMAMAGAAGMASAGASGRAAGAPGKDAGAPDAPAAKDAVAPGDAGYVKCLANANDDECPASCSHWCDGSDPFEGGIAALPVCPGREGYKKITTCLDWCGCWFGRGIGDDNCSKFTATSPKGSPTAEVFATVGECLHMCRTEIGEPISDWNGYMLTAATFHCESALPPGLCTGKSWLQLVDGKWR